MELDSILVSLYVLVDDWFAGTPPGKDPGRIARALGSEDLRLHLWAVAKRYDGPSVTSFSRSSSLTAVFSVVDPRSMMGA